MISRAVDIVQELRASLNLEAGGQIAANMADLYDYASNQLVRANLQNKPELLDEAANLLRQIRSAWIQIPALQAGKP
jgi:flagellar protein FliS